MSIQDLTDAYKRLPNQASRQLTETELLKAYSRLSAEKQRQWRRAMEAYKQGTLDGRLLTAMLGGYDYVVGFSDVRSMLEEVDAWTYVAW